MTLTDLIAAPEHFGSEKAFMESVLATYNKVPAHTPADTIAEMFLTDARADLRLALPRYVGQPVSWAGYNASILLSTDLPAWQYLLSRRQLQLLYKWLDGGEGSLNRSLRNQYTKEWVEALNSISGTINGSGGVIISTTTLVSL